MFYEEMKFTLPLIYAQKIIVDNNVTTFQKKVSYKKVNSIYGPFRIPSEAAHALNISKSSRSKVNEVLKGKRKSVEGFIFWFEKECEYKFLIPDVKKYKKQIQLRKKSKHTEETLSQCLRLMGFRILSISTLNGTATRITAECCRENCNGVCQRTFKDFVSDEAIPICKGCWPLLKFYMQNLKHKTLFLHEVRSELASYYYPEKNNNLPFSSWRKGSKKKIFLTCPQCLYTQSEVEATTPNKYTTRKRNGEFYTSFKCSLCNSLKVKFPEIALQWDVSKNGSLSEMLSAATNRLVWWKCEKGHTWEAFIDNRTIKNSNCPQCALMIKDSKAGELMKTVIRKLFTEASIEDEVILPGTLYRNDCVATLKSGLRIIFEMQGDYWHYDHKKLLKSEHGIEHKDVRKIASNRASGDLVFLLNEYDFNTGRNILTEDLMRFAIQDIISYVKTENFAVGCDFLYNHAKCQFTLKSEQAYYITRYKQTYHVNYNEKLHPRAQKYANFQNMWSIFEDYSEYIFI
ncbi:zinc-ribbon domain-containing protein [Solibacillus silvestris]|uniref:zinc-ribbon domain-containing protein n=1 Tax=Solibacillus silvestris TaxID=76853 RepID=UPI003F7FAB66